MTEIKSISEVLNVIRIILIKIRIYDNPIELYAALKMHQEHLTLVFIFHFSPETFQVFFVCYNSNLRPTEKYLFSSSSKVQAQVDFGSFNFIPLHNKVLGPELTLNLLL